MKWIIGIGVAILVELLIISLKLSAILAEIELDEIINEEEGER